MAAEVGAAAALTGLLFVAVSINLERILSFPKLPARAAETLSLLLLVVVIVSLALAPQPPRALAAEIIACAGLVSLVTIVVQLRHGPDSPTDPGWWFASRIATAQVPALLFLTGGITLAARHGGGLYWVLPATLTAFLGAVYNAWVLLVEIVRQPSGLSLVPTDDHGGCRGYQDARRPAAVQYPSVDRCIAVQVAEIFAMQQAPGTSVEEPDRRDGTERLDDQCHPGSSCTSRKDTNQ